MWISLKVSGFVGEGGGGRKVFSGREGAGGGVGGVGWGGEARVMG